MHLKSIQLLQNIEKFNKWVNLRDQKTIIYPRACYTTAICHINCIFPSYLLVKKIQT